MPPKTVGSSKVKTEPHPKIDFLKTSLPKIKSPRTLVLIHNLKGEGDEIAMLHPLSSAMSPETVVVLVVPMDSLPSFLILRPNLHGLAHVQAVYCSAANHTAPGN